MREENYWVIIPPPVVADKALPSGAKLVFGRINALVTKKGYCYASNEFLGKHLDLAKKTVSNYVSMLAKRGHLRVELIRDERNRIKQRRIFTHLSTYKGIPVHNPIQLKMDKSIEYSKEKSIKYQDKPDGEKRRSPLKTRGMAQALGIPQAHAHYEWQDRAARMAKSLGFKPGKAWFKLFKMAFRNKQKGMLEKTYTQVADANMDDPEKYFYKVFYNNLRENGPK